MRFEAFGPLRVISREGSLRLRPAHRRLLAALLLDAGSPVSAEALIDRMWGEEPPTTARTSLHVHLSALRQLIPDVILTVPGGYQADLEGHTFDVAEFTNRVEEAAEQFDQGRLREASEQATGALDLWQGTPYEELVDVDAARAERGRLEELSTRAAITLARSLTLQGRVSESIAHLRATLEREPFNEPMWEELIHAYYLAGRQVDALHAYNQARKVLAEELGLEPGPRLRELEERVLLHDPELMAGRTDHPAGSLAPAALPAFTTTFFERPKLISELSDGVADQRLTTLTGVGGLGKTRLAVEAARRNATNFADGVAFVALDLIDDPELISLAIAEAVSRQEAPTVDRLAALIGDHHLLLVLDNCEHLVGAVAAAVITLLETCPKLSILATSRTPLGVAGESIKALPPLGLPADGASPAQVGRSEAARFFVEAATRVRPGFKVDQSNAASLASLCRELAGIPLALELAASRCDVLTPADLEQMVKRSERVVESDETGRPERHHSLDDTVAWSLGLLTATDRRVFESMAVFAGPVAIGAIEAVSGVATTPLVKALQSLAHSSLITVDTGGEAARYGQLPPIRQAAARRLDDPDLVELKRLHAAHFFGLAAGAAPAGTAEEEAWFQVVDRSIDEIRAALEAAKEADPLAGLRAAIGLVPYWRARSRIGEGRNHIRTLRDLARKAPPEVEALALKAEGTLALLTSDLESAESLLGAAVEAFTHLGDHAQAAATRSNLGGAALDAGKLDDAFDHYTTAREWFVETDDQIGLAATALNLGTVLLQKGESGPARDWFETALDAFRRLQNRGEEQIALERLSEVAWVENDVVEARAWLEAARRLAVEVGMVERVARADWLLAGLALEVGDIAGSVERAGQAARNARRLDYDTWWSPQLLETAAKIAATAGDPNLAGTLVGAAHAFRRATGATRPPTNEAEFEDFSRSLRTALGDDYGAVLATGQSLSTREALRMVMEDLPSALADPM